MSTLSHSDPKRELLRHTLATLAYRGAKALRDAPPDSRSSAPRTGFALRPKF